MCYRANKSETSIQLVSLNAFVEAVGTHTSRLQRRNKSGAGERNKDEWCGVKAHCAEMRGDGIASRAEGPPHVYHTRASAGVTRALDLPGTGSVTDAVSKESSSPGWYGPVGEAGSAGSDRADAEGTLSLLQHEGRSSHTAQGPGNEGWYMRDSNTRTPVNRTENVHTTNL